jgi:hypothetical protein
MELRAAGNLPVAESKKRVEYDLSLCPLATTRTRSAPLRPHPCPDLRVREPARPRSFVLIAL